MEPPPNTQALNSATFTPPPLDGSLAIIETYDWHAEHNPDHPLFVYADGDGEEEEDVKSILWPEAVRAIHRGGHLIRSRIGIGSKSEGKTEIPVIAILAAAGTLEPPPPIPSK